jgi:hypothetical protein
MSPNIKMKPEKINFQYLMPASACNGLADDGNLIAAASDSMWQNRSACGRYYLVQCIGATNLAPQPCKHAVVKVKIVDYCPPGCRGTINLSKDAFSIIADPRAGTIKVNYTESSNSKLCSNSQN